MPHARFILLSAALGLAALAGPAAHAAAPACQDRCHEAKSRAYQSCRAIPPADRARRRACFKAADDALARCLARCK